jgi:IS30 family transposase
MTKRPYRRVTEKERLELWERWHRGESLGAIARSLERHSSFVSGFFGRCGGFEPRRTTRFTHDYAPFHQSDPNQLRTSPSPATARSARQGSRSDGAQRHEQHEVLRSP